MCFTLLLRKQSLGTEYPFTGTAGLQSNYSPRHKPFLQHLRLIKFFPGMPWLRGKCNPCAVCRDEVDEATADFFIPCAHRCHEACMRDFNDHLCPRCLKPVEKGRRVSVLGAANTGSPVGPNVGEEDVTPAKKEEGGMKGRQPGITRIRGGSRTKGRPLSIIHEAEEESADYCVGQEETEGSKEGEVCRLNGEGVKKGYGQ